MDVLSVLSGIYDKYPIRYIFWSAGVCFFVSWLFSRYRDKVSIARADAILEMNPLVGLLRSGSAVEREEAAAALSNLANGNSDNKSTIKSKHLDVIMGARNEATGSLLSEIDRLLKMLD